MADTRISELPAAAPLTGAEQGVAVQSGATVRFSLQNLPVSIPTQTALGGKEPAFSKNAAFNKDFGTIAGTVLEGDKYAEIQALRFPAATIEPTANGELVLQLTDNATLTIKVKGTDGVVRSVNLTLA